MADDRIKREIEDLLNRLDDFVPDERAPVPIRRRSPRTVAAFARGLIEPLTRVSLRHVMLAALVLVIVGFVGMRVYPVVGRWMLIGGLILFLTSFVLSLFGRSGAPPPRSEKRWRGRPMDLDPPSFSQRLRSWLGPKRRPRP